MSNKVAHLFIVVVYDSLYISTINYFLDFSFFMSHDDAHYQNHRNAPYYNYDANNQQHLARY